VELEGFQPRWRDWDAQIDNHALNRWQEGTWLRLAASKGTVLP